MHRAAALLDNAAQSLRRAQPDRAPSAPVAGHAEWRTSLRTSRTGLPPAKPATRKLQTPEQRPSPEARVFAAENSPIRDPRLDGAALSPGNTAYFPRLCCRARETHLAGWGTRIRTSIDGVRA